MSIEQLGENEMHRTDNLPDGFYLLHNQQEPKVSLVRLYGHPDFDGVRHIAFGPWDGAALMPVWDLREDSTLTPAVISAGDMPTNCLDLLVHNVEFSGVPVGHSINHPAGGTSAATQG